jgi:hypothetical protein
MAKNENGTIFGIMREEYLRLSKAERDYERAIKDLPRGSPRKKSIRNGEYLYLAHREGSKVIYDYVGPIDSAAAQRMLKLVSKRQRLTALLKETRLALREVKKVLRGKI